LAQSIVPQGQEFVAIAPDGSGGAIVTWPDARNVASGLDVFAHHVLASGAVDPTWPLNGTTVCAAPREQISPIIVPDGAGGAFIVWIDDRASVNVGDNQDVYAQHVLASGLVDPAWPVNGAPVTTAPKPQTSPAVTLDGVGGIFVAWSDLRTGNPGMDLLAQHVLGSGVVDPAWPAGGLGLSTAPGSQAGPRMIQDGANGAIVAWTDTRDGTNEIFAQRFLVSGTIAPGWPVNGRAVSVNGTDEVAPTLASDGTHGAIVAWGGGNSGHHNMLAQHLLDSGVLDPTWLATGVRLGFGPAEETEQVMVPDGAGGAIVAWTESFDIFAQHVLASGVLDAAYPRRGRTICNADSLQRNPKIVVDGAGGAIVAWRDSRGGDDDIYAFQIPAAGTVGVPDPTVAAGITFAPPRPNPATTGAVLRFALPRAANVRLAIYDTSGRRVRLLTSGATPAGEHVVSWDLSDDGGHAVGAGLYFARLDAEGRTFTGKLTTFR
jgi:hypothetical protein